MSGFFLSLRLTISRICRTISVSDSYFKAGLSMSISKESRLNDRFITIYSQGRRYWGGGGVTHPQNFKKSGKFGQNKEKFGQNNGKFCHKWQHLWLLVHPIKFGQFYKSRIFGQFNQSGFATPLYTVYDTFRCANRFDYTFVYKR